VQALCTKAFQHPYTLKTEKSISTNKNNNKISIIMTDQEFYDDEFIVMLTIDGTSYDEIEVKVTDPNKTIRDQINSIVQVFELPKMDNGGNPIQYLLGKLMDGDEEPVILEFEDEEGREMALIDYDIQPMDHLHLISVPIAG
jgi:hypothetical protein